MLNGKRILGIVPARSGSKGLPGKNIKMFCGKPLSCWSIEQGQASQYIDQVVLSTDSAELACVVTESSPCTVLIRPPELASDKAASIDVILDVLAQLAQAGQDYDYVVLLEPTSPLREVSDIDGAIAQLLATPQAHSIVGVAAAESGHPSFLFKIQEQLLRPFSAELGVGGRRQDLVGAYYYLEGSVYVSEVASLQKERTFYHAHCLPWVVSKEKAIEIDDLYDFIQAEALMAYKLAQAQT